LGANEVSEKLGVYKEEDRGRELRPEKKVEEEGQRWFYHGEKRVGSETQKLENF